MAEYDGSQIVVLEGLEAVRKRPGMYIGSTGKAGLHHLVWEILDNGIDEHLAGYCNEISITLRKDGGVTVEDHGRGVPVDLHPTKKIPAARVVYTVLHAGGKFGNGAYKVSGGLHGVGASVVNALSTHMIVEIRRNGNIYMDEYRDGGKPVTKLVDGGLPIIGTCKKSDTGTKVTFYPDGSIFETTEFKADTICKRLKEVAFLNKGLTIAFSDERTGDTRTYYEENGIKSFVSYLVKQDSEAKVLHEEPIYIEGKKDDIEVEVAFQYTNSYSEQINSYCNRINVVDGGTLVTGFKTALTRVINGYARELGYLKGKDEGFDGKDIRNGILAIVSIKHPDPQFEGQTKAKLGSTDAKFAVDEVFAAEVTRYFDKNVEVLKKILENSQRSYNARKASDKARTAVLKQLNDMDTKSKLAACSSKKPSECEIYIVEGDSAGGTVKTARNRQTQAVLPLRGKILNVEKANLERILQNNEIKSMINAFGCGIAEEFDITKLRYDKIIILTDADVDGAHISMLLLTFFFRFMPELITEGKVYRGLPPLYKADYEITYEDSLRAEQDEAAIAEEARKAAEKAASGKRKKTAAAEAPKKIVRPKKGTKIRESRYLMDDFELEKFRRFLDGKGKIFGLQRYKGLGEMDANQLWETTLDPEQRVLAQITISDAVEADEVTNLLMGSAVPPRKAFIMEEAKYAKLDV